MSNKTFKSFFIPKLCRFSLNDAIKPTNLPDPSSPKLGCTGQIKRPSKPTTNNKNNHFLTRNFSASTSTRSSSHSARYFKLENFFSSKKLISPVIDNASNNNSCKNSCVTKRSKSCNARGRIPINKKKYYVNSSDDYDIVKVTVDERYDPPLPVVKCRERDREVNLNLSKRRGIEVKTLEIRPIRVSMSQNSNNNNGRILLPTS